MEQYKPIITCIMSNYNTDEILLKEAIESVLSQTIKNFEFIIVDDCSTNSSFDIIEKYAVQDKRIKIIKNKKNYGLAYSLNRAIKLSKGKYIARMDTDDICYEKRFEEQIKYMLRSGVDVCGTFAKKIGDENTLSITPYHSKKYSKPQLFVSTFLIHPTVMIKKEFITTNNLYYNEKYTCAQDIELWCRMSQYGSIAILNKVLLKYRIHKKQISLEKKELQKDLSYKAHQVCLNNLENKLNSDEIELYKMLCGYSLIKKEEINGLINLSKKISNNVSKQEKRYYKIVLNNRIFNLILKSDFSTKDKIICLVKNSNLLNMHNLYSLIYRIFYTLIC